ncbi:siderophore iron transporter [Aspergillus sclerotioniger CBS 115572]|uniref:Siderophore iron transporter n=1 Tax=Aspergillus sclerotioniger CBS 115572 TaxID=1450535 RepID=A0A317WBG8_9EURO|nr:siderophore iron transporter [Aspergillus sclerotioniger CBS 115572]PWY83846.1 siderophore iron transporter [Aspergillus sclerotioniger CBS 115572]
MEAGLVAYFLVWLVYLVQGILSATTTILAPYVTSAFALHALTPTVGILSSVVGGVTSLTLAKVLDVFGRPHGYLFCTLLATIGLLMLTACGSVQAYAAAQVLQTVGNNGIQYILTVFVADTSSLRKRGLIQALVTSPNLIVCWLAGPISATFLNGLGWRWAFGVSSILVPCSALTLFPLLLHNHREARMSPADGPNSRCTGPGPCLHSSRQFDAVGLVLLSAGVALFLLPFNLYALQGLSSVSVLSMLILGTTILITFIVWERYYAIVTFVPYSLLRDPTVVGTCMVSATLFASFGCWNSFFGSYLQVVNGLTVESASYVVQSYVVCSTVGSISAGGLIHATGRFKRVCLYLGIPLGILGSSLMMYACQTDIRAVGPLIFGQILLSLAAGTILVCDEIAILAAAADHNVALCLAVLGVSGNIGGAIGLTVASAIWQAIFPSRLREYLPVKELPALADLYANLSAQLSHPVGSPTRLAIQHAYDDAQLRMLAVGSALWVAGSFGVVLWKDINVFRIGQGKTSVG